MSPSFPRPTSDGDLMCMVDEGDGFRVYSEGDRRSRKERRCDECGGAIAQGDVYHWARGLDYEWDHWSGYTICRDCHEGPCRWLMAECGGYCHHGVQEDLEEHWTEPDLEGAEKLALGRLIIAMRRRRTTSPARATAE